MDERSTYVASEEVATLEPLPGEPPGDPKLATKLTHHLNRRGRLPAGFTLELPLVEEPLPTWPNQ